MTDSIDDWAKKLRFENAAAILKAEQDDIEASAASDEITPDEFNERMTASFMKFSKEVA